MAHWAAKGVLCECIDDGAWVAVATMERIAGPKKGDRLVVTGVEVRGSLVIIGFKEYGHGRWGFDASSFRPLATLKSDLAHFTHHLAQNGIHLVPGAGRMIRPAVQTFAQHHNGHHAAAVRMPAQQSRWQEFSQVSALADMPHDSSGFGRRLFASIFSSGRVSSIAARRGDLIVSSRALKRVGSPRLFHDLGSYFADRSHAVGALPLLRNPFLERQHLHLASNLCGAALAHHVSLSSFFTRWIKKYQQVRTMFWVIPPSCRRAI